MNLPLPSTNKLILNILAILSTLTVGYAQSPENEGPVETRVFDQQFELREDNDFLHFTDRYYSTGTWLGLRKMTQKGTDSTQSKHYSFYLLQEIFTPADLLEENIQRFERPYAGFLGLSNEFAIASTRRLLDFKLLMGFAGPWSGAEKVQSAFHSSAAEDSRIATWEDQIANSFHLNAYFNYVREWKCYDNPFSVHFALSPTLAFGTRDAYVQNDLVFYFGNRKPMNQSIAYKQMGSLDHELFFAVRIGYRYLFHDGMIEGNWLGDRSAFTVDPYNQLLLYNFEMYYRWGRNDFKLTYNFETPRTPKADPHLYVSLSYSRSY